MSSSLIYPVGDEQTTPNIKLSTWGMNEVLAANMVAIDTSFLPLYLNVGPATSQDNQALLSSLIPGIRTINSSGQGQDVICTDTSGNLYIQPYFVGTFPNNNVDACAINFNPPYLSFATGQAGQNNWLNHWRIDGVGNLYPLGFGTLPETIGTQSNQLLAVIGNAVGGANTLPSPTCTVGSCSFDVGSGNFAGTLVLGISSNVATGSVTFRLNSTNLLQTNSTMCFLTALNGTGSWSSPSFVITAQSTTSITFTFTNSINLVSGDTYKINYLLVGR